MTLINKHNILVLFVFLNFWSVKAQTDYKVKYVKDSVFVNGVLLKRGNIFSDTDSLTFNNDEARILVCYKRCTKRRLILGKIFKKVKVTSLEQYKSYFESQITRSKNNITLEKLQHLKINTKIGIIDTLKIQFHKESFVLDNHNYFYLGYYHNGIEINKKLRVHDSKIIIPRNIIKKENMSVWICHYKEKYNEIKPLTSELELHFIDKKEIKTLVNLIEKLNMKMTSKENFLNEYITTMYPDMILNININIDKL